MSPTHIIVRYSVHGRVVEAASAPGAVAATKTTPVTMLTQHSRSGRRLGCINLK